MSELIFESDKKEKETMGNILEASKKIAKANLEEKESDAERIANTMSDKLINIIKEEFDSEANGEFRT